MAYTFLMNALRTFAGASNTKPVNLVSKSSGICFRQSESSNRYMGDIRCPGCCVGGVGPKSCLPVHRHTLGAVEDTRLPWRRR